ncbi:MAG: DNA polymerase III subunit delta [Phycisphaerae bacterium]|nr:MAG: DNA polymerase III subunit delta [Planctomycetota bacterium]KAB2944379.1 MAG: DNA polymerase III subunit delta [Phycisphaerae bacterium]MBE7457243.1 DNA polymerase III subunit delta [Planctomycetia bacterium]MCK6465459.1 DNA polymerase III subunit delta [Phycisphaerae bacterium]MCL4719148.1 DNA polymerase III subunit delta [Phycisphaerae bacterium]
MTARRAQAERAAPVEAPVRAVVSEDGFLRRRALRGILAALERASGGDLQISDFEGKQAALAEVLDEARTVSMFGGRRVVVVEDGETFVSRHREAIERYLEDPSPTGVIVLVCASLDKRTRVYKALAAGGAIEEIETFRGRALTGWLIRHAQQEYGKALSERTAALIRELAGDEMGLLDMELAKLATYTGDRREIREEDVEALLSTWREENVFALLDAMADGDTAAAIAHWRQVLATDPAAKDRSVGGLAWGVRRLLQARRALDEGQSVFRIASGLLRGDAHVVERRLSRVTTRQVEKQLSDLHTAELAIKTGGSAALAIEKWIVTHSAGGRRVTAARAMS